MAAWPAQAGSVALSAGKIEADWSGDVIDPPPWLVAASEVGAGRIWFPPEVIVVAVRWYLRFNLSYRDVEELLLERGIEVDHVTVYRWEQRFTPLLADAARLCRHAPGDRWFVDETYVRVSGVWRYVYRAVDQHVCGPGTCLTPRSWYMSDTIRSSSWGGRWVSCRCRSRCRAVRGEPRG
jgi:hypothetical protein